MKAAFPLLISLVCCFACANCWSNTIHMIIYAIARKDITTNTWNQMNHIFSYMKEKDANYAHWLEMACWADDIKVAGMHAVDGWHFYNNLIHARAENSSEFDYPGEVITNKKYCLPQAIVDGLSYVHRYGSDVTKAYATSQFHKSWMLRFLVNLIGKLHQPLSTATRISSAHKDGDDHGRLFKLNYRISNLFDLWEQSMGNVKEVSRPLSSAGEKEITAKAEQIIKAWPKSKLESELKIKDVWTMAEHSKALAESKAYKDISEGGTPSPTYLNDRNMICEKMMALAGYRMAEMLNEHVK